MVNIAEIVNSPDGLTTINVIASGDIFTGELQTTDDTDWIEIELIAGVTYTFEQDGDTITDFEVGIDQIDLTGYGPISALNAIDIVSQSGPNVVLDLGQYGPVTMQGIDLGDLLLDDFVYIPDDIVALG